MKTGTRVIITADHRTVDGVVLIGSANGRSLLLEFEAILYGYVGRMPVLRGDDGVYRELATKQEVVVTERSKVEEDTC